MALHIEDIVEHGGLTKEIDEGAMSMLFDNLQRSQYQYPMKSTVRELVSNGIDAINEKHIALDILSGKAKVEDYYYVEGSGVMDEAIRTNKGVYKDSSFDPDYYDPQWLDTQNNIVQVEYRTGSDTQRDKLVIKDPGVGLGKNRLEGVLRLGYSTKRLSKNPLGKYGLGAKVALSTGVTYYTMISRYNGQESVFHIYSGHVESVVPHLDLSSGKLHDKNVMKNGYEYYTRETRERNGTEIQIEVKKHMKSEVISAVQNQLLYFSNVSLKVINQDRSETPYTVQAEVLFENEKIIISNNNQFSKPHIVINNVSYGYLDFLEMELEEKRGNIGIKVSPQEVEVSPSRESVIWSKTTKDTIIERFKEVKDIAADYIAKELVETDFVKWHRLCRAVLSRGLSNSSDSKEVKVLSILGEITDLNTLSPKYTADPTVRFKSAISTMAPGITVVHVHKTSSYKGGQTVYKVERDISNSFSMDIPILFKEDKFSFRKDMYLISLYPQGFYVFTYEKAEVEPNLFSADISAKKVKELEQQENILSYIKASQGVKVYQDVDVPEGYTVKEVEESEEAEVTAEGEIILSDKERRELEGKIVARTPRYNGLDGSQRDDRTALFTHTAIEIDPKEISSIKEELYYSTSEHTPLMHFAAIIMRKGELPTHYSSYTANESIWSTPYWEFADRVRLLDISAKNRNYFAQNWAHITSFYTRFENGILSMSNELIKWNTARVLHEKIKQLEFMTNFDVINSDIASKYKKLKDYHDSHYRSTDYFTDNRIYGAQESMVDTLVGHLEKVNELQLFTAVVTDPIAIVAKVRELFPDEESPESVKGAAGLDLEIYALMNELLEYSEPIHIMLNSVYLLTSNRTPISLDQELEIKAFIAYKTS